MKDYKKEMFEMLAKLGLVGPAYYGMEAMREMCAQLSRDINAGFTTGPGGTYDGEFKGLRSTIEEAEKEEKRP